MSVVRRVLWSMSWLIVPAGLTGQAAPSPVTTGGSKKPLTINDYTLWRTIDGAVLSADGRFVAYGTRLTNVLPAQAKPVIRVRDLQGATETEVLHASQPQFSPNGAWLSYLVEPPAPPRGTIVTFMIGSAWVQRCETTACPAS